MAVFGGSKMVTPNEAIQILFKEYDTLRAELIARNNGTFQLMALGAAEIAVCVGWWEKWGYRPSGWILVVFCLTITALLLCLFNLGIGVCTKRVREIENHVNELAGVNLLCWENRFGAGARGWIIPSKITPDLTGTPVPPSDRWKALSTSSNLNEDA
jgi:hypothetical protein